MSPYLDLPLRTESQARAEMRRLRDAADDDTDALDKLLSEAHAFRSAVLAAAPDLNVQGARDALAPFADLFDDMLGDTLAAARQAADNEADDNSPMARPGRAA